MERFDSCAEKEVGTKFRQIRQAAVFISDKMDGKRKEVCGNEI